MNIEEQISFVDDVLQDGMELFNSEESSSRAGLSRKARHNLCRHTCMSSFGGICKVYAWARLIFLYLDLREKKSEKPGQRRRRLSNEQHL